MARRMLLTVSWCLVATSLHAAPPNDECTSATVITGLPFSETIDVSTATSAGSDPGLPCLFDFERGERSVWYRHTATDDVVLDISTAGSGADTTVAAHPDGCGTSGPFLARACVDDDLLLSPQSRAFVALDQGETVLIEVTSPLGDDPSLTVSVRHAPEGHPGGAGAEFQVNTYTAGDQGYYFFPETHALCTAGDGDFVVVWQSEDQDGDQWSVFGQRFGASGAPSGAEFQVTQHSTGYQYYPDVACDPAGGFVVAWEGLSAGGYGVHARRFDGSGAPLTGDVDVATGVGARNASVAIDGTGNFLVTYDLSTQVFAKPYDSAGTPLGPPVQLDDGLGVASHADAATNANGDFVVVWEEAFGDEIRGRRLDASAAFVGSEFTASLPGAFVREPSVSIDPAGSFVVTWVGDDAYGYTRVQARHIDSGGTAGPIFTVNDFDDENVVTSDVALDADGNFVVVWEDYYYTRSVLARRFLADGTPIGDIEFAAPTVREYFQHAPHVAPQPGGDFVVAWVGYDGYDYGLGYFTGSHGVKARRFQIAPQPPTGCPSTPRLDCKQPTVLWKGRIQLRDRTPDTGDSYSWKWVRGEATTSAEFGNPLTTDAFTYCLYDGADARLMEGVVPPGGTCGDKPCWKDLGGVGFKYSDKAATNAGVQKLVLKQGLEGSAKVIVKGKGAGLSMPALSLALPVRAQLASSTGTCWEAEFQAAGLLENTAAEFAAKAHAD